jgi:hypothetical protein
MNGLKYTAGNFSKIYIESTISADIRRGDECGITATGDGFSHIKIEEKEDTIKIRRKGFVSLFVARPHITVTMPQISELVLSGASQAKVFGFESESPLMVKLTGASHAEIRSISSGNTGIEISGASNLTGDIKVNGDIKFNITGASRVELTGSSEVAELELSGASQARLGNFSIINVNARISGASSTQLNVSDKLDVNLSGASRLEYDGGPTLGSVTVSGASTFKQR